MKKIISAVLFSASIVICPISFAAPLISSYQQLLTTLKQGDEVRAILNLAQCTGQDAKSPQVIGGMNFTQFNQHQIKHNDELVPVIATSINMLVESAQYGHAYNYVRLRIFENNTAEVVSAFLNAKDFSVYKQTTFQCQLSNDKQEKGITLYQIT